MSNIRPTKENSLNDIQNLVAEISSRYQEEKASKLVGEILQRIYKGQSYREIYEYCRTVKLGKILKETIDVHEFVLNRENYKEFTTEFMEVAVEYAKDINDMAEVVQKALNDSMGIKINPKNVKVKQKTIEKIMESVVSGNDVASEFLKFSSELIDEIIIANAEIQSKSGFDIVVVRRYDDIGIHDYSNYADNSKRKTIRAAKECPFCKEREGVYEYEETKKSNFVWQRHPGCSCSIDYVNKGMTERVQNYRYF